MKYFYTVIIFLFIYPSFLRAQGTPLTGSKVDTVKDLSDAYALKDPPKSPYYDADDAHTLTLFGSIGASVTTLHFNGAVSFPKGTSRTSVSPLLSAGIDMLLNKRTQRFIIRFEGAIKSDKYSFENVPLNSYTTATLKNLRQTTFTASPQLIYNVDFAGSLKLFVGMGIAINGAIYSDHLYTKTFTLSNGISYTGSEKYPRFQRFWLSIPVKAGISISRNVQVYAGYSWYTTFQLDPMQFPARMNGYQAGIYYLLK